ncbi:MAG: HRDC domain-containing protein, partial [Bacteroidales bacterium]|nr:HRDC domain-containing protein [Bacteroidales bacterium]
NSIIKSYEHHKHELFGFGKDKGARFWLAIIRQGLVMHFLDKDIEQYGLIFVTQQGEEFFKAPHTIMLAEDREFTDGDDDDEDDDVIIGNNRNSQGGGADPVLFAMLKDVRHSLSKKLNLPPFVIFTDPSLEDMSLNYPITVDELKNCQGVGEGKAKKYGKEFLALIAKYVEENDIDRPTDFVVKSVVNKSANKVYIIQNIDRKIPLDDIADAKNMELSDLIAELEAIVNAGTKINIDYYLRQNIDEDKIDDIYEYFRYDASSDSVIEAMKELGRDYSEEEVRLVRIKFMSELAN